MLLKLTNDMGYGFFMKRVSKCRTIQVEFKYRKVGLLSACTYIFQINCFFLKIILSVKRICLISDGDRSNLELIF